MESAVSSVGVYIHIPVCEKKCPYCAFYSVSIDTVDPESLTEVILAELDLYNIAEPVETIYIGGGSPTSLPHTVLTSFISALCDRLGTVQEFTVECNPAQADKTLFKQLYALGVNRLSVGAQSFDANELKTLGRIHQPQHIARTVQLAKETGFKNIGLDLIFGVPGSTLESWQFSLKSAVGLEVQHISAYSLTIEKDTPFERAVKEGTLSTLDEQADRRMYNAAREILRDAGFRQYEISNFAKPGFECRHNLRYWKNAPVIGAGPAAAGWYNGRRTINVPDTDLYIEKIQQDKSAYAEQHTPVPKQVACETAVLGLRMSQGINLIEFEQHTGFDLMILFGSVIKQHIFNGLLEYTSTHCQLTEKGLSYADTVAADFASLD